MHSKQVRDFTDWMARNGHIEASTTTERPDHGTIPAILAILIGAYFVIRALN